VLVSRRESERRTRVRERRRRTGLGEGWMDGRQG